MENSHATSRPNLLLSTLYAAWGGGRVSSDHSPVRSASPESTESLDELLSREVDQTYNTNVRRLDLSEDLFKRGRTKGSTKSPSPERWHSGEGPQITEHRQETCSDEGVGVDFSAVDVASRDHPESCTPKENGTNGERSTETDYEADIDHELDTENEADPGDEADTEDGTDTGDWIDTEHGAGIEDGADALEEEQQKLPLAVFAPPVAIAKGATKAEFHGSITISDDQSVYEKVEQRQFLALQERAHYVRPKSPPVTYLGNQALERHQMQLMLLEQQNKKRLMMARQEGETHDDLGSSRAEVGPGANKTSTSSHVNANGKRDAIEIAISGLMDDDLSRLSAEALQNRIQDLQKRLRQNTAMHTSHERPVLRYQTLYRLLRNQTIPSRGSKDSAKVKRQLSGPFLDPPQPNHGQGEGGDLQCKLPIDNFELFLERNKDVSFIVYCTYVERHHELSISRKGVGGRDQKSEISYHIEESIHPVAVDLARALETLLLSRDMFADILQKYRNTLELHAPYLFMYHHRKDLDALQCDLDHEAKGHFVLFSNFVMQQHGAAYSKADAMISRGRISSACVDYLFKPGDILISQGDKRYTGCVASSWARRYDTERVPRAIAEAKKQGSPTFLYDSHLGSKGVATDTVLLHQFDVQTWAWDFNGNFQRARRTLSFVIVAEDTPSEPGMRSYLTSSTDQDDKLSENFEVPINDLRVFPIQAAPSKIVEQLRRRGRIYWQCRKQRYVTYRDERGGIQSVEHERYMIDIETYSRLHPGSMRKLADELGPNAFARDDSPDDDFTLLLPTKIKGFNLRRKKWYDLVVDQISDVQWNKDVFQKVVIDRKVKDLIRALVSNQLAMEVSTDLIEGKGNGLILLLHGGPGTGKTLTAESVAEIAEKPLYRVTCGDVGTKAEDVEKYLESVFHLGKRWSCVVLLDEADVFLEQRSLEDLQRNALVSVFLRTLEYYEGILVLTSNRVGVFDEAFKSRIQLALHYPSLGSYQRLRIWENFFDRLASFNDELVDVADLRDNLDKLAEEKMNGRQIRNAITTARQYAVWKETKLTYAQLRDVIEVSRRFDKYLDQLNGGFTQDQLAQDDGIRLA